MTWEDGMKWVRATERAKIDETTTSQWGEVTWFDYYMLDAARIILKGGKARVGHGDSVCWLERPKCTQVEVPHENDLRG